MGHSEVFANPRSKLNGPYMGHSEVVSNPHEKEPIPREKNFFIANGTYMCRSGVKGLNDSKLYEIACLPFNFVVLIV